jgi:hypothetical protein
VVHLHFGPSVRYPDCLTPPALRPGQALGCSVVNRPIRRGGTFTLELRTLRGLLRGDLFIEPGVPNPLFLFVFPPRNPSEGVTK